MPVSLALLDGPGPLDVDGLARAGAPVVDGMADALDEVMDAVATGLRDDPGLAGRVLTRLRPSLADLGAAELLPTTSYLLAQVRVREGQLAAALTLIDEAREGHLVNGDRLQAARTNLGRAGVLNDLGRYDEALRVSADALAVLTELAPTADPALVDVIASRAHMNRAISFEYSGRFAEALDAYEAAEVGPERLGDSETLADVVHNRADLLMTLGRVGDATEQLRRAAHLFDVEGSRLRLAVTLVGLARGHIEMGEPSDALTVLERSSVMLDEIDAEQMWCEFAEARADAYASLNLVHEAIDEYRDVHKWLSGTEFALERARTNYSLGRLLTRVGDREAGVVLDGAIEAFRSLGHAAWVARALVVRGAYEATAGDADVAAGLLAEADQIATASGVEPDAVRARLALAALRHADAPTYAQLHREAADLGLAPVLREVSHAAGRQALDAADLDAARRYLDEAAVLGERQRSSIDHESLLVGFGLAADELVADRVRLELLDPGAGAGDALAVADRGKSRSLVDLALGACRRGSSAGSSELQVLEGDLHAAYRQMFGAGDDATRFAELRHRAAELEGRIRRLQLAGLGQADRTIRPVSATAPVGGRDGSAQVSYACLGDELVGFVRVGDAVEAIRLSTGVAAVRSLLARLDAQHGRMRLGDEFATRNASRLALACRSVLGQLHEAVFAPIAVRLAALGAGDDLVIAPHGPLHAVPFHALWDGESYLLERLTVSVTPSLAVYDQCAAATRPAGRPLVVGIGDQLAPRALDEAHAIAAMIGADLLAGEEATAAAVAGAAPGRSLLHVASHAWHRADNPMFSAIRLADRWVTAAEVLDGFDLVGTTVVLSACDTGRSSLAGSELLGLVRGFLGAGAASLVVSLWPTHDAATAELMHRFHEALPRLGTAAALRAAQLHGLSTFGHPSFWAPFTLVGAR